jgi:hypothetical protein
MKTDEILTPLDELKETALDLVMANAPDLDIVTTVKLTTAIALKLIDAESEASERTVQRIEAGLTAKGLA